MKIIYLVIVLLIVVASGCSNNNNNKSLESDLSEEKAEEDDSMGGERIVSVSKTSGSAPLTVKFEIPPFNLSEYDGIYYSIDFGNGRKIGFPSGTAEDGVVVHTFENSGEYDIVMTKWTGCNYVHCSSSFVFQRERIDVS